MALRKQIDIIRFFINRQTDYDVVHFSGQHTLRSHLVSILDEYQIESIIDVGANEGQFALSMRSLGFRGKIYSFEPVDAAYEKLKRVSASDNSWFVFDFALGAESGEALINVSDFSSFSSILDVNKYALDRWKDSEVTHQQGIVVRTLDECASEGVIDRSDRLLLKMDTQGYDLEVFRGAQSVLSNVSCVLSELSLIPIYEGMPSYSEALSVFEGHGFSVSGFYPITRNKNLTLNEVDCVLVNTSKFGNFFDVA